MGESRTVDAIDAYDILQDGSTLVGGLPVEQNAIGLDAGERNERCDGHLETEQVDEFLDGLGEDLIGSEGDPVYKAMLATGRICLCSACGRWSVPEECREHAGRLEPARGQEDDSLHVVAGDVRGGPVEGVLGFRQHRGREWSAGVTTAWGVGRKRNVLVAVLSWERGRVR